MHFSVRVDNNGALRKIDVPSMNVCAFLAFSVYEQQPSHRISVLSYSIDFLKIPCSSVPISAWETLGSTVPLSD